MKIEALIILIVIALGGASISTAEAQTLGPSCTYAWDANPSTDNVIQYHLYLKKDGVQMPDVFIPATSTSISCLAAGVTVAGLWTSNVHAINEVGEGEMSNTVEFTLAIAKPKPGSPKNHRAN